MSKKTIVVVGLILFVGWLVNLCVTRMIGEARELYPLTAWPMYSNARDAVATLYKFHIEAQQGAPLRKMHAVDMIAPHERVGRIHAFLVLRRLETALRRAAQKFPQVDMADSTQIPEDLQHTWNINARKRLKISHPPYRISLVKYEFPLDRPAAELGKDAQQTVIVTIKSGIAEITQESPP